MRGKPRHPGSARAILLATALAAPLLFASVSSAVERQEYVLLGWNDLGMHCANADFATLVVLPPYNNVRAQLIRRSMDGPPQLIDHGVRIEYSIPGNTTSVNKTNFWDYAQQIFGLPTPLPDDIGLTGNGLTGTMVAHEGFYEATGIPITPFPDDDLVNEHPFQLIRMEAWDEATNELLATTEAVIPVSNEIGCVQSGCHSSEQNILNEHEDEHGFNPNATPILCASCHASPALGTEGIPEARYLSYRIHEKHAEVAGPANAISTCYKCHPGPNTECLRGVMATGIEQPMICQDCHGTMAEVANSISNGRVPWLDEPSCGECHGAAYAEEPGQLFRNSFGHGGLQCSVCHGEPHAIYPSSQANDNLQSIRLQGHAGTLSDCRACHAVTPTGPGPHGTPAPPDGPLVTARAVAAGSQVELSWAALPGATAYRVHRLPAAWAPDWEWTELGETTGTQWNESAPADERAWYRVTAVSGN